MALARLVLTDDTFPFVFLTTLPLLISPLLGPRLARGWTRRYLARRVPLASVRDRKRGDTVMLAGTIRAGAWFETTGDKHRAVIANYTGGGLLTAAVSRPWTETRALDFVVDLPGGEAVRVSVRDAYLADREDPFGGLTRLASDANVAETSVGPGDEVEVLGVLDFDIDADAAGPGRSARLAPVLRAGTLTPLLVCPKKAAP